MAFFIKKLKRKNTDVTIYPEIVSDCIPSSAVTTDKINNGGVTIQKLASSVTLNTLASRGKLELHNVNIPEGITTYHYDIRLLINMENVGWGDSPYIEFQYTTTYQFTMTDITDTHWLQDMLESMENGVIDSVVGTIRIGQNPVELTCIYGLQSGAGQFTFSYGNVEYDVDESLVIGLEVNEFVSTL